MNSKVKLKQTKILKVDLFYLKFNIIFEMKIIMITLFVLQ